MNKNKGYWIAVYKKIENLDNLKKYSLKVTPIIKKYGGVPLVRGGNYKVYSGAQVIDKCEIITLPKIEDSRGNLTFIEGESQIPFAIKRVYYLYDVPAGSERGDHAHIALNQIIIALAGSFDVERLVPFLNIGVLSSYMFVCGGVVLACR